MKKSIGRRIFISNFILVFFTITLFEIIFFVGVNRFYYGGALRILTDRTLSNTNFYNMYLKYENLENKAHTILMNYKYKDEAELQIIDIDGNIIISSTGYIHSEKINTEHISTLRPGEVYSWQGRLKTTGEEVIAVLSPLVTGDKITGYLRFVSSVEEIRYLVNDLIYKSVILGGFILLISSVLAILLSQTLIRPIKHLTAVSKKIAKGNLDVIAHKKYDDEIGELSDALNFMAEELKKSDNMKNEFISSISHEIRTPLTSIRGWAETIENGGIDSEENKQGISIILKESKRLTGLVEQLLDFSRFESGRLHMNFEEVDLNSLIKDVLKLYAIKSEEKNLHININLDPNITYITGDADRLRQVFINIIDNACKFSYKDGQITVSTLSFVDGANVYIEDQGIGIPANDLPRATEKFYKGKSKRTGTGLGLAISKEIVIMHNGTLNIESIENKGTKVIVSLPKNSK